MIWRFLTERLTIPILGGPLAGKRWLAISRRSFLLGTYEAEQVASFADSINEGDVVFDIGAHWGYFTLLASECSGPTGRVFAFEPLPHNLVRLRRHVDVNECDNVTVLGLAVSDRDGTDRFNTQYGSRTGHLSEDGQTEVRTAALDGLVERGMVPPPTVMKVDVEGAEMKLLRGAESVIASAKPLIFLSTHHFAQTKDECHEFMGDRGYALEPLNGRSLADATDFLATPASG